MEVVRERREFYAATGVSRFDRARHAGGPSLRLDALALHHRGHDTGPFVKVPTLAVFPGDRIYLKGRNGCGKSSLLKAVAGLWPYGAGTISLRHGTRMMFAGQEPDIPDRMTLKELVTYPEHGDGFTDIAAADVLSRVGLGQFIAAMDGELYEGNVWRNVLSGGQKQRLVLARILLQAPDILLLDESISALDVNAAVDFHIALRERLPDAAVLAVLHTDEIPCDPDGEPFYTGVLDVIDGVGLMRPVSQPAIRLAAE
jgi:ABC-type uncharacterized transport system fused permease/ATPase subunit